MGEALRIRRPPEGGAGRDANIFIFWPILEGLKEALGDPNTVAGPAPHQPNFGLKFN